MPHLEICQSRCFPAVIIISQTEPPYGCVSAAATSSCSEPIDDHLFLEGHVDVVADCEIGGVILAPESGKYFRGKTAAIRIPQRGDLGLSEDFQWRNARALGFAPDKMS